MFGTQISSTTIIALAFVALVLLFAGVFAYFWTHHRRYIKHIMPRIRNSVFLEIQVPKEAQDDTQKTGVDQRNNLIAVAEQVFTTLSELGHTSTKRRYDDYISFEIAAIDKKISFYINCPYDLRDLVEKQVHAQYPSANIEAIHAYNPFSPNAKQSATELVLQKDSAYPFRTYKNTESDPLNAITNAMSKLEDGQSAVVQLIISPAGKHWQDHPLKMASEIQQGKNQNEVGRSELSKIGGDFRKGFSESLLGKSEHAKNNRENLDLSGKYQAIQLTPMQQEIVKRFEEKASRPGFYTNVRIVTSATSQVEADSQMRNLLSSFMQYSMPPFNGFKVKTRKTKDIVLDYIFRVFTLNAGMLMNTEELASIWHLPTPFIETPSIKWLLYKKAPAPINMPTTGPLLGINTYRGQTTNVRIARDDRRRHTYVIGRTGSGKSELIKSMAIQDIQNGEGVCVIDPHGDLVEGILEHIPKERAEDVILFEPFDTERPMGLNVLEIHSEEEMDFAVQEMISIFYKLVTDPAMLGPMFEHYMRNAMLALMADKQHPGTIVDIPKIFTDTEFQKYKVSKVTDAAVKNFWEKEMAKVSDFHKSEMLGYLVSKVGRFVENSMMRNIIGQSKSSFDFRDVMDKQKILLINLAKGKTGEINAKLIGLMIVSKIQMAALSRADMLEEDRKDFYLYVDEFQNFITDSFATILSEARKYRLNLTIAHQYLGQLSQGAGAAGAAANGLRDAVFGNVGTEIAFRIGVEDSEVMAKEFAPTFSAYDLLNVDRFNAYVKLMVNGTTSKPFNMATLPPMAGGSKEVAEAIRTLSRLKFGRPRAEVEAELAEAASVAETHAGLV
jgi:hypothetical protein